MMKLAVFAVLIGAAMSSGVIVSSQRNIIPHHTLHGYGTGVSARYFDKAETGLGLHSGLVGYGGLGLGSGLGLRSGLGLGLGLGSGLGAGRLGLGLGAGRLGLGLGAGRLGLGSLGLVNDGRLTLTNGGLGYGSLGQVL